MDALAISKAGTIIGAQSSEWGSIGAVISYLDVTKALEMRGLKPITITSREADLKAVGSTVELTEEKRAYLQARVDKLGADFRAHVKRFRGDVADETKRGGMFYAPAARDAFDPVQSAGLGRKADGVPALFQRIGEGPQFARSVLVAGEDRKSVV